MIWPFENDTSAVIKNMAQKSIAFDKKKNLFCISAIVVAVAMIMMSLLTVQNIIHQNQNEVSGLHQGIFFDITQKDKENLSSEEGVQSIGLSCNIKTVEQNSKELRIMESVCHRNSRKSCLSRSAARMTTGQPESRELVWEWQSAEIL